MNERPEADVARPRNVSEWLADAVADAQRRGLPQLKPLLEGLAQATTALREAEWNEGPSAGSGLTSQGSGPV